MPLSEDRVCYLLEAYTNGVATKAEEEELMEWVSITADDTLLKKHIHYLIQSRADKRSDDVDWENLYQRILAKARNDHMYSIDQATHWNNSSGKSRQWREILAAAAILAFIIISSIFLFSNKNQSQQNVLAADTVQRYKNDIAPGGTKAILQAGNVQVRLNKKDTSFTLAGNTVRVSNGNVRITNQKPIKYTITTPRGGEYKLTLADGTNAWINADSKLVFPSVFTGDTREITLEGEAYFEVKTDADHPFIVYTPRQSIRVLGTSFNVHAYSDEENVITTLVEGKVQVNSSGETLLLNTGQQAALNNTGQLSLKQHANINQAIAWKNGYFQFTRADIHTIMQQLSHWYNINVKYEEGLQVHYFGAIMNRNNNISQILHMLEATGDVHFKIEGNEVVVMP